jgi:hypothetical protein
VVVQALRQEFLDAGLTRMQAFHTMSGQRVGRAAEDLESDRVDSQTVSDQRHG